MTVPALAGIGGYTPRLRIDAERIERALGRYDAAGIDRKAVPEADEDALTMAYEGSRRALDAADCDGGDVVHLAFATTTPPMAEEDLTARLASMLGAPDDVRTWTATGSTRAGGQALDAALDAGPWDDGIGLIVASDCPRGSPDSAVEHAAGAGAVAVVLTADGSGIVRDRASHVEPYPGTRFRATGDDETTGLGITQYDRQAFTTVLGEAADGLAEDLADVDAAAVQSPDGSLPNRAAGALGVEKEVIDAVETVSEFGDTGAASPFFGLATAAADGYERVLLAAYGSGAGANLFVIDSVDTVPVVAALAGDGDLTYPEYLRRRGEITREEPEGGGAYVSVPSWQRTIPQRHRLVAGRCSGCDALTFPPEGVCQSCGEYSASYEPVELPGTGSIEAVTTIGQGGAPPEFVEQQSRSGSYDSAIVAFDGPDSEETVSVPAQVLAAEDRPPAVGSTVEATIRRLYQQEGVIRYGFKVKLADSRR